MGRLPEPTLPALRKYLTFKRAFYDAYVRIYVYRDGSILVFRAIRHLSLHRSLCNLIFSLSLSLLPNYAHKYI